jgi:glycerol-3-phosphate O-acyltransferase
VSESGEHPVEVPRALDGLKPYVPIELYRSAMVRKWGLFYYLSGFALFFRKLRLTEGSGERVRQAAKKGPVVYAMHTRSTVDYLALNEVLRRRRLPLADYGTGISMTAFMPFFEAVKLLWDKVRFFLRNGRLPNPVDVGWLSRTVSEGQHTAIFLQRETRARDFFNPPEWPEPVAALLRGQAAGRSTVQVLPVVVIWQREPERAHRSTLRALLGTEESRGRFWKLFGVARGARRAVVQVGEPVDLVEFTTRFADEPQETQSKRLRLMLRRYLFREQHIVRGPRLKSRLWTRRLVLKSARVRRLVEQEAVAQHRPVEAIQAEVLKAYDKMAARWSYALVGIAEKALNLLWKTIFRGVDVRPEDMERIRQAQREGVAVLVPSHRSHLDYVLLSWALNEHDVVIPHVIAGENLSFFPLGPLFRSFGAIFIKRSFQGERVFPVLFQSYLTHLFREGYTVEFFIEGGRSRTGKCLPPKLGVLGYTVDAGVEARVGRSLGEVTYLPIAITYEQVAEEEPYARELEGQDKKGEDVSALIRAGRVLFRRYGRVYVRVGEPVKLTEQLGDTNWSEVGRDDRKEFLQGLGEDIVHRINDVTVVLPTGLVALALMAQSRSGVPGRTLEARVRRFRDLLVAAGAENARSLVDPQWAQNEAMARFLKQRVVQKLEGADDVVYLPVPDKRVTLEYYKNALLHFLLPGSLVAAALRAHGEDTIDHAALMDSLRFQLWVLRYEFVWDPDADVEQLAERGLAQLRMVGAVEGDSVVERRRVTELAELTANFLESYYLTLRALPQLRNKDLDADALARQVQVLGRQFLAVQDLRRPESLSIANIKNALRALREDGIYTPRADGGLELDQREGRRYVDLLRSLMRLQSEE